MEIGIEPVFKLLPEDVLPIDIQRCLLCQSSEIGKLVKNPSQIANILDKLKLQEHNEIEQYSKINKCIHIAERSTLNLSSYHTKCYRKLGTSVSNLKQLIHKCKLQKSGLNNQATLRENKQLSRSALPAYKKDKCIFCQLEKNAKLNALGTNKM